MIPGHLPFTMDHLSDSSIPSALQPSACTETRRPAQIIGRPPYSTTQGYNMKMLWLGNGCLQHVRRLRPLRPLYNLELDIFSLFQTLESFSLERGIMNKNIVPALKTDKPEPLAVIEPLYRTFALHKKPPFLNSHAKLRGRRRNTVAARILNGYTQEDNQAGMTGSLQRQDQPQNPSRL